MANCVKCGEPLSEGMGFCPNCGAPVDTHTEKVSLFQRLFGGKKAPDGSREEVPEAVKEGESTHPKKKTASPLSSMLAIGIVLILIVVITAIAATHFNQECVERWVCGDWSKCDAGTQTRVCVDKKGCGGIESKPATERACEEIAAPENNTTEEPVRPACNETGFYCVSSGDCCEGYCVHGICQENATFCGDGYCDSGENCSNCPYDCGSCPRERELEQNVFTEPIGYFRAKEYEDDGYVVVRYFYSKGCDYCYEPVNIENQLRNLAADARDLFVLVILDVNRNSYEAGKYARVGSIIYKPLIRVEGVSNNQTGVSTLYGGTLGDLLQDGDISGDVASLICQHSDYCDFIGGRIVRKQT